MATDAHLCIEIDGSPYDDLPASVEMCGEAYSTPETVGTALDAVEPLLTGQWTPVVQFLEPRPASAVVAVPAEQGVVALDRRTVTGYEEDERIPPEESRLDHRPVPVETQALVAELLAWIERELADIDPDAKPEYYERYEEATGMLQYHREHGSLEEYEHVPSDEAIEAVLFGLKDDNRVLEYIRSGGVVARYVEDILDGGASDEQAAEKLKKLVTHDDDEIAARTFDALDEYDDLSGRADRVARPLLHPIWYENPDWFGDVDRVERALTLLGEIDSEYVREQLCNELAPDHVSNPDIRAAIARTLGALDGPLIRETLVKAGEEDPDSSVRGAATAALDQLESE